MDGETMIRWKKLRGSQYLGFWPLGLLFLALQQAPYLMMPLMHLEFNPLMSAAECSPLLCWLDRILEVLCVLLLLFLVSDRVSAVNIDSRRELVLFSIPILFLLLNYWGWLLYFIGRHSLPVILFFLAAMPPLYDVGIGIWRRNPALIGAGILFLIVHTARIWNNFQPAI